MIEIFRKTRVPAIYTKLDYVRESATVCYADCPKDLELIRQIQDVVKGKICVSNIERLSYHFMIKAVFPENIMDLDGTSDELIEWHFFSWKVWDAETLITHRNPAEAVPLIKAGIEADFIDTLAHPSSCLPILRETEKMFQENSAYTLDSKIASEIKKIETPLIARIKLHKLKQL